MTTYKCYGCGQIKKLDHDEPKYGVHCDNGCMAHIQAEGNRLVMCPVQARGK